MLNRFLCTMSVSRMTVRFFCYPIIVFFNLVSIPIGRLGWFSWSKLEDWLNNRHWILAYQWYTSHTKWSKYVCISVLYVHTLLVVRSDKVLYLYTELEIDSVVIIWNSVVGKNPYFKLCFNIYKLIFLAQSTLYICK